MRPYILAATLLIQAIASALPAPTPGFNIPGNIEDDTENKKDDFLGLPIDPAISFIVSRIQNSQPKEVKGTDMEGHEIVLKDWLGYETCVREPDVSTRYYMFSAERRRETTLGNYEWGTGSWLNDGFKQALTKGLALGPHANYGIIILEPWELLFDPIEDQPARVSPGTMAPQIEAVHVNESVLERKGCVPIEIPGLSAGPSASPATAPASTFTLSPHANSRRTLDSEFDAENILGSRLDTAMEYVATKLVESRPQAMAGTDDPLSYSQCIRSPGASTAYTIFQVYSFEEGDKVLDKSSKEWLLDELKNTWASTDLKWIPTHEGDIKEKHGKDEWTLRILVAKSPKVQIDKAKLDLMHCVEIWTPDTEPDLESRSPIVLPFHSLPASPFGPKGVFFGPEDDEALDFLCEDLLNRVDNKPKVSDCYKDMTGRQGFKISMSYRAEDPVKQILETGRCQEEVKSIIESGRSFVRLIPQLKHGVESPGSIVQNPPPNVEDWKIKVTGLDDLTQCRVIPVL
ncbi:hypothetical protein P154DRAFT_573082 [Amniculicola lignicola CBS 123094]|uniref:Uncharacterized protein n=1 Tax=Amniculicola lignicola CBS 123094 TaxID=1392246 RepID=A0A6A5WNN6_9PLEO|nr:hypothetical protein P154DRAFT_573082 [Amniculicola lignicola CBS 123094]